jgi:hypothetical protein
MFVREFLKVSMYFCCRLRDEGKKAFSMKAQQFFSSDFLLIFVLKACAV